MNKIISQRSLISHSIIVGFLTFFLTADWNLFFAAGNSNGIQLYNSSINHTLWTLWTIQVLKRITYVMLRICFAMAVLFICASVSSILESYSVSFAKLSLIGATEKQIIKLFVKSLLKLYLPAMFVGSFSGMYLSYCLIPVYITLLDIGDIHNFAPGTHFFSFLGAFFSLICILLIAIALNVRKLIKSTTLKVSTGNRTDLSSLSRLRMIVGIVLIFIDIWWVSTDDSHTGDEANTRVLILGILLTFTFYFFTPIILKLIIPVLFTLLSWLFPIDTLLGKRNFHATIRNYTSIAAPIIVCLVFSVHWFVGVVGGEAEDKQIYLSNKSTTAVVTNINPNNHIQLDSYVSIRKLDNDISASPLRMDIRWVEQGSPAVPVIEEVNPKTLEKISNVSVTSGNINYIRGLDIASNRPQDKLGKILHMIGPSGKKYNLRVIAMLSPFVFLKSGLVVNYASFPEAGTTTNIPKVKFPEERNYHLYDIFYAGTTVNHLRSMGIPAISYRTWVNDAVNRANQMRGKLYDLAIAPFLIICLALVINSTASLNTNNRYIRTVVEVLGGSKWQDLRILFLQLFVIFSLALIICPTPAVIEEKMMKSYMDTETSYVTQNLSKVSIPFSFPYHQISLIFIILICGALLPPMIKIFLLHGNKYSKVDNSAFRKTT